MKNPEIPYKFEQLLMGLEAFVANIQAKLQYVMIDLPVFVLETGDISYLFLEKFVENTNKEIYLKTPRFVIIVDDIQQTTDLNTNPYNKFKYIYENEIYTSTVRRLAHTITINTNFVSPNFIKGLENFEIMSSIMSRENVFTYEFLGNTYEGAYGVSTPSLEKPTMDAGSNSRNYNVKNQLELIIQLFVPRIETISKVIDFDHTEFNIIEKDGVDPTNDLIINLNT